MRPQFLTPEQDAQREREWLRWFNYWQPTNAELEALIVVARRQRRLAREAALDDIAPPHLSEQP